MNASSHRLVVALPGAEAFARLLAPQLGAGLVDLSYRRFPDGESYLRLLGDVRDAELVLVASLRDPDPQALSLWFLADAARDLGAQRVGLVVPYLPYMRQDIRFQDGEAVTNGSFARFISQAFDWLVTVDPHLHRIPSLDRIYRIPATAVASAPAIARWVGAQVVRPVIVGPDSESEQWVHDVAARVGCPSLVLEKRRLGDREVQITVPMPGDAVGCAPVLIDDIISSGRTMAVAAGHVGRAFGEAPQCVAVHAVFAPDALQVVVEAGARQVVTCNTLPHPSNAIDVSPEVAQAVRAHLDA